MNKHVYIVELWHAGELAFIKEWTEAYSSTKALEKEWGWKLKDLDVIVPNSIWMHKVGNSEKLFHKIMKLKVNK